ncbi:hypothetical protein LXL04_001489 [Taraxacum kok-saghyz]
MLAEDSSEKTCMDRRESKKDSAVARSHVTESRKHRLVGLIIHRPEALKRNSQSSINASTQPVAISSILHRRITTSSLETRFQQFKEYDTLYGFLFPHNLRGIEDKNLKSYCHCLEKALRFEIRSDIDAEELYMELKLFETLETSELSNPIDFLKFMKELEYLPNACIAYRILLTIPVTKSCAAAYSVMKIEDLKELGSESGFKSRSVSVNKIKTTKYSQKPNHE